MSVRTILMAMVMTVALLGPAVSPKAEAQIILQDEEFDINGQRGMTGGRPPDTSSAGLDDGPVRPSRWWHTAAELPRRCLSAAQAEEEIVVGVFKKTKKELNLSKHFVTLQPVN